MIIRVSGHPGAGKTTLCKKLSETLGYEFYYSGGVFRKLAAERNLSLEAFYASIANDPDIERAVDAETQRIINEKENLVIDSRIAPFQKTKFLAVSILLTVSPEEGARRELLRPENSRFTLEEMMRITQERLADEKRSFKKLYGIDDQFEPSKFDIVLDTTDLSPDEEFTAVMEQLSRRGVLPLSPESGRAMT